VPNELWSRPGLATPQPHSDRDSLGEIQLPLATRGSQQGVAVAHVAHRLEIRPACLAAGEREQHQLCVQGCPEGESQHKAHRNVAPPQDACSTAKILRRPRTAVMDRRILRVSLRGGMYWIRAHLNLSLVCSSPAHG